MTDFRYNAKARDLEDSLLEELEAHAAEKAAEDAASHHPQPSGLKRIADGKTPLEEVKAIIEAKRKTAAEVLRDHVIKGELVKRANKGRVLVEGFLRSTQHDPRN